MSGSYQWIVVVGETCGEDVHYYIHFECPKIFNTLQECKDSFADYEDNHFGPARGGFYYARYLFNEPVTGSLQPFVLDSLAAMQSHNDESSSASSSSSSESYMTPALLFFYFM